MLGNTAELNNHYQIDLVERIEPKHPRHAGINIWRAYYMGRNKYNPQFASRVNEAARRKRILDARTTTEEKA